MTGDEIAAAAAPAVTGLPQGFMFDPATYVAGAGRGFDGIDFYFAGRAGVLGDVDADVVTAALVFFNPDVVRARWEASAAVMPRAAAAAAFAACAALWAEEHLTDDVDWVALAALAGKVVRGASLAGAPLFAGWRRLAVPDAPKPAALRQLNLLRELRMARHTAAVVATGLPVDDAVRHHSPLLAEGILGWSGDPGDGVADRWAEAERLTNHASALDYAVLDPTEAADVVALCTAARAAVT